MGNTDAQFNIGAMYLTALGGFLKKIDNTRAIAWLVKATEGASPAALYTLGHLHLNGLAGGTKDCSTAMRLFNQAVHHDLTVIKNSVASADRVVGFLPRLAAFHLWGAADIGLELAASNFAILTETGRVNFFQHAKGKDFAEWNGSRWTKAIDALKVLALDQFAKEKSVLHKQLREKSKSKNPSLIPFSTTRKVQSSSTFSSSQKNGPVVVLAERTWADELVEKDVLIDIYNPLTTGALHSLIVTFSRLFNLDTIFDNPISNLSGFVSKLSNMRYVWAANSKSGFLAQIIASDRIATGLYLTDQLLNEDAIQRFLSKNEMNRSSADKQVLSDKNIHENQHFYHKLTPLFEFRDPGSSLRTLLRLCPIPPSSVDPLEVALKDEWIGLERPNIVGQYDTPFAPHGFQPPTIGCLKLAKAFFLNGGLPTVQKSLMSLLFSSDEIAELGVDAHNAEYIPRLLVEPLVFASSPFSSLQAEKRVFETLVANMQRTEWAIRVAISAEDAKAPALLRVMLTVSTVLKKFAVHAYVTKYLTLDEFEENVKSGRIARHVMLISPLMSEFLTVLPTLFFALIGLVFITQKVRTRQTRLQARHEMSVSEDGSLLSSNHPHAKEKVLRMFESIRASAQTLVKETTHDNTVMDQKQDVITTDEVDNQPEILERKEIIGKIEEKEEEKKQEVFSSPKRSIGSLYSNLTVDIQPRRTSERSSPPKLLGENIEDEDEDDVLEQSAREVVDRLFENVLKDF
eukprot:GDKJ01031008.1.p1 GENE.GDKJ01031008.1~~GDKJ01031008.1.p1  ORF type:complete len:743 (-),score=169.22 GDKJ01031008.1:68-2296(-)